MNEPLAERVRPKTLEDYISQRHLVGEKGILTNLIKQGILPSLIFWGPPGIGKTTLANIIATTSERPFFTLSAISSGVKDVREIIEKAKKGSGLFTTKNPILFIDEIHRFSKSQQDSLLGAVEKGWVTLIGATTENPSFEVIPALLSRCQVYILNSFDKRDLILELEKNGFSIDLEALPNSTKLTDTKKQGYLLAPDAMPKMVDGRGDFLSNATHLAIESLSTNEEGFFLMVEGSQIDWGGHDNDAAYLISELIDFDNTIGVALDFAKLNGETLVIVTADHETGGFTLAEDNGDYNKIKPLFSTDGHSATMIPVFAKGPNSEDFGGIYENTVIYNKMKTLFFENNNN